MLRPRTRLTAAMRRDNSAVEIAAGPPWPEHPRDPIAFPLTANPRGAH